MRWSSFFAGFVAAIVLAVVIALGVILSGAYDVAATDRHNPIVAWAFETTFENSVARQANGIAAPEFTPARVQAGAHEYKAMCSHCHGGVGASRAGFASGMLPMPPALAEEAAELSASEVFWLVKHGVKMSGMPAFGPSHDDATIWNIAAFVKAMPDMSAQRYAAYRAEEEEGEHEHGGGQHGAGEEHGE